MTQTTTDAEGDFQFVDLSPGEYKVRVMFECTAEKLVTVTATQPTGVTLVLCQ